MKKSLFLLLLTSCAPATPPQVFEFHTGLDGALIWRCNRVNGEVDFCNAQERVWHTPHVNMEEFLKENGIKQ